jgi:transcriptional regulator with XRE-family HTH domain
MNISLNHLDQSENAIVDVSLVANRVRTSRQAAGYSIEDLAVTCGLTSAEIVRIEDGIEIDMQHLKRIAPALQLSVTSLLEAQA